MYRFFLSRFPFRLFLIFFFLSQTLNQYYQVEKCADFSIPGENKKLNNEMKIKWKKSKRRKKKNSGECTRKTFPRHFSARSHFSLSKCKERRLGQGTAREQYKKAEYKSTCVINATTANKSHDFLFIFFISFFFLKFYSLSFDTFLLSFKPFFLTFWLSISGDILTHSFKKFRFPKSTVSHRIICDSSDAYCSSTYLQFFFSSTSLGSEEYIVSSQNVNLWFYARETTEFFSLFFWFFFSFWRNE